MKLLKSAALFLGGMFTYQALFSDRVIKEPERPRVGSVVYENDLIKVTDVDVNPDKKGPHLATIVYKEPLEEVVHEEEA